MINVNTLARLKCALPWSLKSPSKISCVNFNFCRAFCSVPFDRIWTGATACGGQRWSYLKSLLLSFFWYFSLMLSTMAAGRKKENGGVCFWWRSEWGLHYPLNCWRSQVPIFCVNWILLLLEIGYGKNLGLPSACFVWRHISRGIGTQSW